MKLPSRPVLLSASTIALIREARRTPGYSLFDWLHGYVYGRWIYLYIGIGTGEHPLAKRFMRARRLWSRAFPRQPRSGLSPAGAEAPGERPTTFADTYHGKVVTLESATRLISVQQEVRLTDLEHVIPYTLARDIVLKHPDHIVAIDCPCRAARPNPCLPLDVCLIVGEPFASFATEHHPTRSRSITSTEAAEILRAEHERGHVHHAFFKDAMLGRFYAICNCCSCCCGAMQAQRHGVPMLASSGYVAEVATSGCAACGSCQECCQFGAISMNGHAVINAAECMGCGVCVSQCPQEAISLVPDERRGVPLELDVLMRQAMQEAGSSKPGVGRA
ncbi:MAG: 4Fe-4S binding protein [Anaerolineae bacterium]|jgi:ferredoxin|nr:4Fe-4S binding protein [Anaerolineae bacterium]